LVGKVEGKHEGKRKEDGRWEEEKKKKMKMMRESPANNNSEMCKITSPPRPGLFSRCDVWYCFDEADGR